MSTPATLARQIMYKTSAFLKKNGDGTKAQPTETSARKCRQATERYETFLMSRVSAERLHAHLTLGELTCRYMKLNAMTDSTYLAQNTTFADASASMDWFL